MGKLTAHILHGNRDSDGFSECIIVLQYTRALTHELGDMVEAIVREVPPILHMALLGQTRYPYLRRANAKPAAYIDILSKII